MSHHPLSLKENPWSWPVPRLETHVQVFLDQCWCGAAELDFVLPSVSVVSWFKRIRDSIQMHPKSLQNFVFIYVDLVETWTSLTLNIEMLSDII